MRHSHDFNSASHHSAGPSIPRVFAAPRLLTGLTPADSPRALYDQPPLDHLLGGRFRADPSQPVPDLPPLHPSIVVEASKRVDYDAVNAEIRAAQARPKAHEHADAVVTKFVKFVQTYEDRALIVPLDAMHQWCAGRNRFVANLGASEKDPEARAQVLEAFGTDFQYTLSATGFYEDKEICASVMPVLLDLPVTSNVAESLRSPQSMAPDSDINEARKPMDPMVAFCNSFKRALPGAETQDPARYHACIRILRHHCKPETFDGVVTVSRALKHYVQAQVHVVASFRRRHHNVLQASGFFEDQDFIKEVLSVAADYHQPQKVETTPPAALGGALPQQRMWAFASETERQQDDRDHAMAFNLEETDPVTLGTTILRAAFEPTNVPFPFIDSRTLRRKTPVAYQRARRPATAISRTSPPNASRSALSSRLARSAGSSQHSSTSPHVASSPAPRGVHDPLRSDLSSRRGFVAPPDADPTDEGWNPGDRVADTYDAKGSMARSSVRPSINPSWNNDTDRTDEDLDADDRDVVAGGDPDDVEVKMEEEDIDESTELLDDQRALVQREYVRCLSVHQLSRTPISCTGLRS
ncbi:hypothetical protein CBER1_03388 [Cercospora berteroae]|uniref:Uncharacterized protein n=1 Tax=Cercospora berteroae TaxID=357750 RepID=A0A2S6C8D7_9PEZI|nr:hypothetical protein CBER1_03388 [Cercospora berteroae]